MHQRQPFPTTFIYIWSQPWFFNAHQKDSCWQSSSNIKNRCPLPLMNKWKPQDILLKVLLQSLLALLVNLQSFSCPLGLLIINSLFITRSLMPKWNRSRGILLWCQCCLLMSYYFVRNQLEGLDTVKSLPWSVN